MVGRGAGRRRDALGERGRQHGREGRRKKEGYVGSVAHNIHHISYHSIHRPINPYRDCSERPLSRDGRFGNRTLQLSFK
jgi:hypothetical protein